MKENFFTVGSLINGELENFDDPCELCLTSEVAEIKIVSHQCPNCGNYLPEDTKENFTMVPMLQSNVAEPNDRIEKMYVIDCVECDTTVALKPIPVIYNGNHDIHYTGGNSYVPGLKVEMDEEMKKAIRNYTERIKNGENLDSWNLITWLQHDIENQVARILKEHGLKF